LGLHNAYYNRFFIINKRARIKKREEERDMEILMKTVFPAIVTFVMKILGKTDIWLIALVTAMVMDYLTGLCKAYILSSLSSREGFKGILKKLMYFAIIAVAVIADKITGADDFLRTAVIGFLIANEALSILENCAAAELPVPKLLINVLDKLKKSGEE